jgi:nitrogen fixation protein NifX
MKIAVASTDGKNVNEHFGKATRFFIYTLSDNAINFEEERPTETLSVGDLKHTFDPDKFMRVLSSIKDCKKVIATKVGAMPATKLMENGIEPVIYTGPINKIPLTSLDMK